MVILDNVYMVDIGEREFTLKENTQKKDKDGNTIYKTIGYYSSLQGGCQKVVEQGSSEKLAAGTHSLREAVELYDEAMKTLEESLKSIKG